MLQSAIFGDLQVSSFTFAPAPFGLRWGPLARMRASFSELVARFAAPAPREPASAHLRRDIGLID